MGSLCCPQRELSGEKNLSPELADQSFTLVPAEPGFSKTLANKQINAGTNVTRENDGDGKVVYKLKREAGVENGTIRCRENCWTLWEQSVAENKGEACVYYRTENGRGDYVSWKYGEVMERVEQIAAGLNAIEDLGDRNIGIWSKNRPEWFFAALACWRQECTVVPFYETLGDEAMAHILGQAEIRVMFTEASKLPKILKLLNSDFMADKKCMLHTIYIWNKTTNLTGHVRERTAVAQSLAEMRQEYPGPDVPGITIQRFCDLPQAELPPKAVTDDEGIAVIMYTSGTTGMPKGVMLHHGALSVMKTRMDDEMKLYPGVPKRWRYYSYLPLAHIFEMAMHVSVLTMGGSLWYTCGDIKGLVDDLSRVRPHFFTGVPRVYQKFYDKVQLSMKSGLVAWLLRKSFEGQTYNVKERKPRSFMYDILLKAVAKKIGLNECVCFISGAAPLAAFLHEFLLTLVPGVSVVQGYGMTETACHGTMSHKDDIWGGTVGSPGSTSLIKLRDVPEMGRLVTNNPPSGEILIGGPNVFRGYYKMPEKTAEDLIEHNGVMWVCTGDIGVMNPEGTITIVDRKKNIFKLAQGEYIAVEKIEMCYAKAESLNQVWVYGNSFKTCVVAVVVPSMPWWYANFNQGAKMPEKDFTEAVKAFQGWYNPGNAKQLKDALMKDMKQYEGDLKGFEKVKGIVIAPDMNELMISFTPENGLMTPSMKLKRPALKKAFVSELKELYGELGQPARDGENWE